MIILLHKQIRQPFTEYLISFASGHSKKTVKKIIELSKIIDSNGLSFNLSAIEINFLRRIHKIQALHAKIKCFTICDYSPSWYFRNFGTCKVHRIIHFMFNLNCITVSSVLGS